MTTREADRPLQRYLVSARPVSSATDKPTPPPGTRPPDIPTASLRWPRSPVQTRALIKAISSRLVAANNGPQATAAAPVARKARREV
jgi:hypothetical protein